jgi:hypothetical protein
MAVCIALAKELTLGSPSSGGCSTMIVLIIVQCTVTHHALTRFSGMYFRTAPQLRPGQGLTPSSVQPLEGPPASPLGGRKPQRKTSATLELDCPGLSAPAQISLPSHIEPHHSSFGAQIIVVDHTRRRHGSPRPAPRLGHSIPDFFCHYYIRTISM